MGEKERQKQGSKGRKASLQCIDVTYCMGLVVLPSVRPSVRPSVCPCDADACIALQVMTC